MIEREHPSEKALVIHPVTGRERPQTSAHKLEEAVGLAGALGVDVVQAESVTVRDIKAGTYLGGGKVDELCETIAERDVGLVIVNTALAPIQQRNLERLWNVKVIDRTGLILEIFALRATTKEGRLQVELARLAYERSRLVRTWTHLERQRGGQGFLAGPGETQIEADRRMLNDKITRLRADLDKVRRTRAVQRHKRERAPERIVALVGYTNAGKSSLFNRLTKGGVLAKDMLFATLDTTNRILPLPGGGQAVMSDTVGFISDLPTDLIEAFQATLEEVKQADLLLHVRDMADPLCELHKQDVLEVLDTIGAGPEHGQEIIEVWNKIDLLDTDMQQNIREVVSASEDIFPVSCLKNKGLEALLAGIESALSKADTILDIAIGPGDMQVRAWLHQNGQVLDDAPDGAGYQMRVSLPHVAAGKLLSRYPGLVSL